MPYCYRVRSLVFCDDQVVVPGSVTILVGPNNSGKSQALRDIHKLLTGDTRGKCKCVLRAGFTVPSHAEDLRFIVSPDWHDKEKMWAFRTLRASMTGSYWHRIAKSDQFKGDRAEWIGVVNRWLSLPSDRAAKQFASVFGNHFVTYHRTQNRISLANERRNSWWFYSYFSSPLEAMHLFGDDEEVVKELNRDLLPSLGFSLRFERIPGHDGKLAFFIDRQKGGQTVSERLKDQGDGIRSLVSVALSIIIGQRPVVLIDEPEAFLHPSQAFHLGEMIGRHAREHRQIIIATHSSSLLRGILTNNHEASLVRLTRRDGKTKTHLLPAKGVSQLTRSPLLRSTRVLDGLFATSVVAVESDSDQIFFEQVSNRLRPGNDVHFAIGNSKQTIGKIARMLVSLGIPTTVICDFDILRSSGEFLGLLESLCDDELEFPAHLCASINAEVRLLSPSQRLRTLKQRIRRLISSPVDARHDDEYEEHLRGLTRRIAKTFEETDAWALAKRQGVRALSANGRAVFDVLDQWCRQHGLFVVPTGELESLLEAYGLAATTRNKSSWIVRAIELLAKIPVEVETLPWSLLSGVHTYLAAHREAKPQEP